MSVLNPFKNLSHKGMVDTVSWGTLIVFALAMAIFVLILLAFYNGWSMQTPYYS